jgi:hypothetical protein
MRGSTDADDWLVRRRAGSWVPLRGRPEKDAPYLAKEKAASNDAAFPVQPIWAVA